MDRRAFLRYGATAGAALAAAPDTLLASAFRPSDAAFPLTRTGLQLYTVRSLMEKEQEHTLQLVAEAGYKLVETAGLYGLEPAAFRALLDKFGIRAPSGHYPLDQLEGKPDTVFATARTLGHEWIVLPFLDKPLRTVETFGALPARLNALGKRVKAAGFHFAYHNHDFEFETYGGKTPAYDTLLARTDPALVGFELDAYWVYKAGHDPVRYLRTHRGRFPLCHLKDGTPAPERAMTSVGNGTIDFPALFAAAPTAGLKYAFVEHDNAPDAMVSIRASHAYLERILGKRTARR
jgi:sugar phosphate isomerase/epimerase